MRRRISDFEINTYLNFLKFEAIDVGISSSRLVGLIEICFTYCVKTCKYQND
jgi:hypothetical protein